MSNLQQSSLSLLSAAIAVGMTKSAILRAIQRGTISAAKNEHNEWVIQPAELFRVYKPISSSVASAPVLTAGVSSALDHDAPAHALPTPPTATPGADNELAVKLALSEANLTALKVLLAEVQQSRDDWKQQANQLLLQHDNHRPKSFLRRLLG
jgi:hypothetical protein